MSRKSTAALSVVAASPPPTLGSPSDISEREAGLWRAVVESKPAGWFGEDSAPLLKEYVRAVTMCDVLEQRLTSMLDSEATTAEVKMVLDMRDKEARRAANIATKLRLTQQSRYTPQAAGTANKRAGGKRPWQG